MTEERGSREHRRRIAVIDDDTVFLELMRALLEEDGHYDVLTCKEWDDAHGFVTRARPDLVLLDIVMGREEQGWAILELLTLDTATRPIPIIVCSAAVRSLQDHEPLLQQYGVGVLPKPFDLDALLEKIAEMLRSRLG